MKTAEEWQKQYRFTHGNPLYCTLVVADIRAIQADALRHAAELCRGFKYTPFAADAIEAVAVGLNDERVIDKLSAEVKTSLDWRLHLKKKGDKNS